MIVGIGWHDYRDSLSILIEFLHVYIALYSHIIDEV